MKPSLLAISIALLIGIFNLAWKGVLTDIHWDVPVWLNQAQRLIQTDYFTSFSRHSDEISREVVSGTFSAEQEFPESYWWFTRLGHIVVLAATLLPFGFTADAIYAASAAYSIFLCGAIGAIVGCAFLWFRQGNDPPAIALLSAGIVTALYGLSDIFLYLTGNLIAEIPAILFIALCTLLSMYATRVNGLSMVALAALAGLSIALIGATRPEASWVAISWVLLLPMFQNGTECRARVRYVVAVIAASTAIAWGLYSAIYWPLTDPRLYARYLGFFAGTHQGIPCVATIGVAGGALWLPMLLLPLVWKQSRQLEPALAWLVLAVIPYIYLAFSGTTCPTRTSAPLVVPLIFLAYGGVLASLRKLGSKRNPVAPIVLCVVLCTFTVCLSNLRAWRYLREIPGAWKLEPLRTALSVPNYDRIDIPMEVTAQLARKLEELPRGSIIALSDAKLPMQQVLDVAWFLGVRYGRGSDLANKTDPTNRRTCSSDLPDHSLPIKLCDGSRGAMDTVNGKSVWKLGPDLQLTLAHER